MKALQRGYYYLDYSRATDVIKWRMYKIQQTVDVKLRNVRSLPLLILLVLVLTPGDDRRSSTRKATSARSAKPRTHLSTPPT